MTAIVIVAATFSLAGILLAAREIRLYRDRHDLSSPLFTYTRRRLMRRILGSAAVVVAMAMMVLGVLVVDFLRLPWLFFPYWLVFLILVLSLIVISILDIWDTWHFLARTRVRSQQEALVNTAEGPEEGP